MKHFSCSIQSIASFWNMSMITRNPTTKANELKQVGEYSKTPNNFSDLVIALILKFVSNNQH